MKLSSGWRVALNEIKGWRPVLWPTWIGLNPRAIPNLAAWYDVSDYSSLVVDGSNRVSLIADKSGNSATNCLCLNGAASNTARATSSTAGQVTGDIGIYIRARAVDWTPSATMRLVSKRDGNTQIEYDLLLTTGGTLTFITSPDGTTAVSATSSAALPFTDLTAYWIYVTRDVNDGSGNNLTKFYWAADTGNNTPPAVASMTQLGTTQTVVGATSITTAPGSNLSIGSRNSGAADIFSGNVFYADVRNAYDAAGTIQAFFDPSGAAKLATSVVNGGTTWTINSSGDLGARISGERDLVQLTTSKQPIYLNWAGTNYGWQPGSVSYFSTPDAAPVDITGDIDLRFFGAATDWTPSGIQHLVSKYGAAGQRGYVLSINTTGRPRVITSSDGTATITSDATAAVPFADREAGWVRATVDVDNGAGGNTVTFFTSTDGVNWTQLGSPVVNAGTTSIFNNTTAVNVGDLNNGSSSFAGIIYRAQVLNGIGGTVVADFNPALYTSGTTFTASTGEVWTLNGGATIVNRTSVYFDGSDDYMKAAAFSLSQPVTDALIFQQVSWQSLDYIFTGNASADTYVRQATSTPNIVQGQGATVGTELSTLAVGQTGIVFSVFNGASGLLQLNRNASVAGANDTRAQNGICIGSRGDGAANFANIRFNEMPIYSVALDTETRSRLALYAGAKWGFQT